jgi:hypothetical protein
MHVNKHVTKLAMQLSVTFLEEVNQTPTLQEKSGEKRK